MSLVLIIPMLGRPHWVAPLVESIRSTCDGRVLFMLTPGDHDVLTAVKESGCDWMAVDYQPAGDYARKVNTAYRESSEDLLFIGAGDLRFHLGWLEAATAQLADGIGVVGTNDLGSPRVKAGLHATHSLVTRQYVDEFGTIDRPGEVLHEGYAHEFVDDEFVATAKRRKAWAFAFDARVEHLHPNWGKAPMDPTYAKQGERMRAGRALYMQRMPLWK